jgi:hypothetical protein
MTTAGTPINADAPPIAADKGKENGFVISAADNKRRHEDTDGGLSAVIGGASALIGVPAVVI